jgi:hypothetical protein
MKGDPITVTREHTVSGHRNVSLNVYSTPLDPSLRDVITCVSDEAGRYTTDFCFVTNINKCQGPPGYKTAMSEKAMNGHACFSYRN